MNNNIEQQKESFMQKTFNEFKTVAILIFYIILITILLAVFLGIYSAFHTETSVVNIPVKEVPINFK